VVVAETVAVETAMEARAAAVEVGWAAQRAAALGVA